MAGFTTAVSAVMACAEPALLAAVTTTRIVEPTFAGVGTYVRSVAKAMSTQLAPAAWHLRHWYVNANDVVPLQFPFAAFNDTRSLALAAPVIVGSVAFAGGVGGADEIARHVTTSPSQLVTGPSPPVTCFGPLAVTTANSGCSGWPDGAPATGVSAVKPAAGTKPDALGWVLTSLTSCRVAAVVPLVIWVP